MFGLGLGFSNKGLGFSILPLATPLFARAQEREVSRVGAVVKALASHQCGPGWTPGPDVICGLRLLLVPLQPQSGFSPGTPVFPSP